MQVQEKSAVNDLPICPLHGVTLAFMEAPWEYMAAHVRIKSNEVVMCRRLILRAVCRMRTQPPFQGVWRHTQVQGTENDSHAIHTLAA